MSEEEKDYGVYNKRKHLDGCYCGYQFEIDEADLEELKKGKVIYFTLNYGEYAVALTCKERNIEVTFKYDD